MRFSELNTLVVGDIMLDRYFIGDSDRISPEAPIPVVRIQDTQDKLGGAANVANNIRSLGGNVMLFGVVGDDAEAAVLRHLLDAHAITHHLHVVDHKHTITKARVLSRQQQMLRLDYEHSFAEDDKTPLFEPFKQAVAHADVVVFSDYLKGTLSDVTRWIQYCRQVNKCVLVDPKGLDFNRYHGADVLTPNLKEFEAIVGHCEHHEMLCDKAKKLIDHLSLKAILITQGAEGMTLVTSTGQHYHQPTQSAEVVDVTGAGDTVVATFALAMASGLHVEDCMKIANRGAGVVVQHVGTAALTLAELNRAMHDALVLSAVTTTEKLAPNLAELRHQGERIVITNGCFDLLHAGHVAYLQAAKALGDRLIVAVNDDASIRRLKGNKRPYVPLASRMMLLAALDCVDWVVSFSEDTPIATLQQLRPDILVKGPDYKPDEIVGKAEVEAQGGRVAIVTHDHLDISTSLIGEKIKASVTQHAEE